MVATSSQYNFGQEFPETIDLIPLTKYAWDFQNNALWDTFPITSNSKPRGARFYKINTVDSKHHLWRTDCGPEFCKLNNYRICEVCAYTYLFLLQYKVIKKCIGTGFACSVKRVRMYMSSVSLPQRLHNLSVDEKCGCTIHVRINICTCMYACTYIQSKCSPITIYTNIY